MHFGENFWKKKTERNEWLEKEPWIMKMYPPYLKKGVFFSFFRVFSNSLLRWAGRISHQSSFFKDKPPNAVDEGVTWLSRRGGGFNPSEFFWGQNGPHTVDGSEILLTSWGKGSSSHLFTGVSKTSQVVGNGISEASTVPPGRGLSAKKCEAPGAKGFDQLNHGQNQGAGTGTPPVLTLGWDSSHHMDVLFPKVSCFPVEWKWI